MTSRATSLVRPVLPLALLLILLTLPLQRTFANLPTDCAACSGTDECDCDMDGTDDDSPLELPDEDGGRGEDGDEDGAGFGSLRFGVRFGRAANEGLRLGGGFSLHAVEPSALVFTPQFLQYRNRLLDRVLQTEVAPGSEAAVLGADWEARLDSVSLYNRVVVSGLPSGVSHQVRLLGARREAVVFQFRHGEPEGLPSGEKAGLRLRLAMRDADGHATTSSPAYYDLVFGDGGFVRYAVADGKVVSLTTASGRTVTPQSAGLDAVYDPQSGLLRQVWSARDGLAEVAVTSAGVSYEIRLYAPSQVAGRGADGLYAAAGSPHTVWRVSNPNPGFFTRVLVTRVAGGAEETTAYDYSHNAEGWTKTAPDQASVVSSSAVRDAYGLERTVDVIGRTSSGQVASHVRNTVRRHPFGERVVKSVRDPLGARLATVREYDSSGRLASESRPDGSWTRRSYDAQGRVTAAVTPWKDSAFDAADNEAKVVLYSYSPVDGRDTVAAIDARPRVEETKVLGITTSKTYHAYYTENGCRVEVQERCARPDAEYGDADNLRTVKRWHPAGNGASSASAGRLHTVLREDGQMTDVSFDEL